MSATSADVSQRVAEAYRWHRRLGARVIETEHACVVADPSKPSVWDCNHADAVSARTDAEIDTVFAAMDLHLAHTRWRVVHTDGSTPDSFLARLAFASYRERPATIQMALDGDRRLRATALDLRLVESDHDWSTLSRLIFANHMEGLTTGGLDLPPETSAAMVESQRAKSPACQYYLVYSAGTPIGYGASAAAPNGLGMIEDVFTALPHRRRGVASALIATLVTNLRAQGCEGVFVGALAEEQAKLLYARLGFRPVALSRAWVKNLG